MNHQKTQYRQTNCKNAEVLFSADFDGALTRAESQELQTHLEECQGCRVRHGAWLASQRQLAALGRAEAPRNLALRLRVAVSNEIAYARRPRFAIMQDRLEHVWRTCALPAISGAVTAIGVFVLLLSFFAPPPVAASSADVPLLLSTPPELQASASSTETGTIMENSLLVEVLLDEQGRVFDYRILSASGDASHLLPQVKNWLLFAEFRPAMNMGRPITGRALLTFSATVVAPRRA